jgi:hypothetical protein
MPEMMGAQGEAQRARKGRHLRRNYGFRSRAGDHNHADVVGDAKRAAPVMEAYRLEQEVFRNPSKLLEPPGETCAFPFP